jgi:hypothetical protein
MSKRPKNKELAKRRRALREISALGQEQEEATKAHEEKTGEVLIFDDGENRWTWRKA